MGGRTDSTALTRSLRTVRTLGVPLALTAFALSAQPAPALRPLAAAAARSFTTESSSVRLNGQGRVWVSPQVLATRPIQGPAWNELLETADEPLGTPDLSDKNDETDILVLARALVYARTGLPKYGQEARVACMAAIGTEQGGTTLSLGRNLLGYVVAADLVGLSPGDDARFRDWLRSLLDMELDGRTLRSTHEDRPNNWGTHAGASRAAIAVYLSDPQEVARVAKVFRGYLGDRNAYAGFKYGALWWQANPAQPVGINPRGATLQGRSVDGVIPDDQRRGGAFTWPPPKENYAYEALQGAVAQALILERVGYKPWGWSNFALGRAFKWLHEEAKYPAQGDDTWLPHVINAVYGTKFPAPIPSRPGKNMGFTDWTHGI